MNKNLISLPTRRESLICIGALLVWLGVTAIGVGMRPEHIFMAVLIAVLFFANVSTRRLVVALMPFALFGISYDWMNLCPNYTVNHVDIAGLYETEKMMFGIEKYGNLLTPNEFFATHTHAVLDFLAGVFYLCWVPLPIIFGLWLYYKGHRKVYIHFAIVFLLVNLLGFAVYYIHPAAPPWYVAKYGFDFIQGTPGDVAGLGAFDQMTGLSIFHGLYARNANVFAAMPSLHSAYTLVAFIYAMRCKGCRAWRVVLAVVTLGIWFTAVYTFHHYVLDVIGGILCSIAGYLLFERVLLRIRPIRHFVRRYVAYVTPE